MKVKCIESVNIDLTVGKIYEAKIELIKDSFCPLYRIVDDSGEDYLYDPKFFAAVV